MIWVDDGFEGTPIGPWDSLVEDAVGSTFTYGSTDENKCPFDGSKSGKIITVGNDGETYAYLRKDLVSINERFFRVYIKYISIAPNGGQVRGIALWHTGFNFWHPAISVQARDSGGMLEWFIRYKTNTVTGNATIASPSPEFNKWYCVEIYYKSHPTEGAIKVWINNDDEANPDWSLIGQATDAITCDIIFLGQWTTGWQDPYEFHVDCAVCGDTFNGLLPDPPENGNGGDIPDSKPTNLIDGFFVVIS